MARVIAPNKDYNNISAGVRFVNGVGECADPYLLSWFREKGYRVEATELEEMDIEELRAYADMNGISLGNATAHKGILKKIYDAENENQ